MGKSASAQSSKCSKCGKGNHNSRTCGKVNKQDPKVGLNEDSEDIASSPVSAPPGSQDILLCPSCENEGPVRTFVTTLTLVLQAHSAANCPKRCSICKKTTKHSRFQCLNSMQGAKLVPWERLTKKQLERVMEFLQVKDYKRCNMIHFGF